MCLNYAPEGNIALRQGPDRSHKLNSFGIWLCCISNEENEAYNNMLANILRLHTSLVPGVGSKVKIKSVSDSSHYAYQIKVE